MATIAMTLYKEDTEDLYRLTQNGGPPKLLSRIYKELKSINTVKMNYSINK